MIRKKVIAITMGDPAGVGPEICLKALADPQVRAACVPVIIGTADVLRAVARKLAIPFAASVVRPGDVPAAPAPTEPCVIDIAAISAAEVQPGRASAQCGHAAWEYIAYAIEQTAAGTFDAMTTAPISKAALHEAGFNFPGHTEILEHLTGKARGSMGAWEHGGMGAWEHGSNRLRIADCGLRNEESEIRCAHAVMMLTSPRLTVSLVTTHIALKEVPAALNCERIEHVIRLTHEMMKRFLGRTPRIAVLGLNCHAGESGLFGDEEQQIIIPAIDAARAQAITVTGPLPPDTAFTPHALETCDAHVCMYHDQALIPFKALSFADGVNVTLGIPIIRTSVDHGTAFDIAWTGKASHQNLVAAILLAAKLANK